MTRPILDYARSPLPAVNPYLAPMHGWRAACEWCVVGAVAGFAVWPPAGVVAAAAAVGTGAAAIGFLGRAARHEVDAGYAARQVVLAVLLSGLCLLGVWAVPLLVESDLVKWRLVEERRRSRQAGGGG